MLVESIDVIQSLLVEQLSRSTLDIIIHSFEILYLDPFHGHLYQRVPIIRRLST